MPEGQFLGRKASYIYISDGLINYSITRDRSLILGPITGLQPYTSESSFAPGLPKRFEPRGVYWQGVLDGRIVRKFIICGSADADLYVPDGSTPLIIDGVAGATTGKRGERMTFPKRFDPIPNP